MWFADTLQLKERISNLSIRNLFIIIMLIAIVIYFVLGIATGGKGLVYSFSDRLNDLFSDFFASVYDSTKTYDEMGVIYPPFINLFYRILAVAITPFAPDAYSAVSSTAGGMIYAIFILVETFILYSFIDSCYKGDNKKLLLLALLLSMPFLFMIERGNIIFFAAMLLYPFILWYDSEDKKKRYIAYICLALSVNIKLYPIVFALLILRNKQYREFLYFALITAAIFFISLLLLQDSFISFIDNLFSTTEKNIGIGIANVVYFALYPLGLTQYCNLVSYSIMAVVLVLTAYITLKYKDIEKWKLMMLLSLVLCTCGTFNVYYCILYLFIPLVMFLNTNPKRTTENWIYLILFLLMMIPIIGFEFSGEIATPVTLINGVVPTVAIIFVIASLLYSMRKSAQSNSISS